MSWTTQAMRCENHPDHFAGAAVDVLHNAGLDMLQLRTYTLGREEAEDGHIIAAVVHEPKGGPLTLDPVAMQAAKTHDAMLARALAVLELCPRAAGPEWVMATYYA
ncbi:hypothetical protein [Streptomyces sp. NPDC007083]|uniref:hypothetical protein n=1 Tax=Streptomyces sp. NPDC007083 TaxID=3156913 RepID=UPI0033E8CAD0